MDHPRIEKIWSDKSADYIEIKAILEIKRDIEHRSQFLETNEKAFKTLKTFCFLGISSEKFLGKYKIGIKENLNFYELADYYLNGLNYILTNIDLDKDLRICIFMKQNVKTFRNMIRKVIDIEADLEAIYNIIK